MYKHYIEINENNFITKVFSNIFEQPNENSILLRDTRDGHAYLITKNVQSQLQNMQGYYKYKWINKEVVELSEEDYINANIELYKSTLITKYSQESFEKRQVLIPDYRIQNLLLGVIYSEYTLQNALDTINKFKLEYYRLKHLIDIAENKAEIDTIVSNYPNGVVIL